MKLPFLKKSKEKIKIEIPDGPQPSVSTAKDEEIYFERAEYQDNPYDLSDCPDLPSKTAKIYEALQAFEKRYQQTLHKFQFLKLFSRAALKNQSFNEQTLQLEKQINRFKKSYDETRKQAEALRHVRKVAEGDPEAVFLKINALFDYCRNINKDLTKYQETYFPRLKIASYSLCNDMNHAEIEGLNKAVNKMLEEFKNIQEAYDYIIFNSGELINDTVNAFVSGLANSNNPKYKEYDRKYFLSSDFVMVMNFSEWVDLFTKLLYIKRIAKDIELFDYLQFKNHYQELEKRYAIMLIYNEMNRK